MNSKEKIQKILDEVKQLLAEDCLKIEVESWRESLYQLLVNEYYQKYQKSDTSSKDNLSAAEEFDEILAPMHYARGHASYKQLEKMIDQHKFTVNVGNLSRYLSQYPNDMPVVFESWESCMTDAGTDMGGNRERDLQSIVDVDQKVVITL